ncbi:MAG: substrate-binding domain-containing protein [Pseudorhodoplanes sp.]|nr:substrate-binding domain-containing protein [Pseudorhodoplanes sp.]
MTIRTLAIILFASAAVATPLRAEPALITIVGTGDGMELLRAASAEFKRDKPDVRVEVPPSVGSGGGIAAVGAGRAILGRVARKLTDTERDAGIVYWPIFRMPSAFYVHPDANVSGLTTEQLADIYSGRIRNWKEVGGADLRIRVVRREDADSTLLVLRSSMPGWKDLAITDMSKMATTTQDSIETVRDVSGAIGFGPYSKELNKDLTVLKINGRHPLDEGYPSSNEVALIYRDGSLTPLAKDFIAYMDSPGGHKVIADFSAVPVKR